VADIARLIAVIEPEAEALGFELVRVKLSGSGDDRTLQVMAEDPATGQLVVEQCMALSRRVSDRIDSIEEAGEELIDGAYNLEVSSPGIDRPLTERRHWSRARGRLVTAQLADGGEATGRLVAVDDAGLTIDGLPDGKQPLAWDEVRKGRVEIEFNRVADADLGDEDDERDESEEARR